LRLKEVAMENSWTDYLRPPLHGTGIGDYTLHDFAAKWMMQQDDIAEIGKYAADNERLKSEVVSDHRIVLIGDSITEFWKWPNVPGLAMINRGIAGQNSSQMLLRFENDVVDLAPTAVVLLCGTNDLRAYVGHPASVALSARMRIARNVRAMTDIARCNGIKVVLCALPPVGSDMERVSRSGEAILGVNGWLRDFAREKSYNFVDFHAGLANSNGSLPSEFSDDGVHPNKAGYDKMWPILREAITALL
jgi:lysophospholipase L1-like esterase